MNPPSEQNRRHLQLLLELLKIRNLYQSLPLLVVMMPFYVGLLPSSIEIAIGINFGAFRIMIVEVLCILTLPILLLRRHTCVPLLLLSLGIFLLGAFSSFYANIPDAAFGLAVLISWVFLAASKIEWTRNDVYYLGIGSIGILAILLLQIIYYGLGFGSYSTVVATVGIAGETSRVRTTYGPATGTSVIIYILTVFSIFAAYFYTRRIKWSLILLSVGLGAILLLFTRGGLLMISIFAFLLFFFRNRQIRMHLGVGVMTIVVGVGILYGTFFSNQDFVSLLTSRGQFLQDSNRAVRYAEAFEYGKQRPMGGGLNNYYFRNVWLNGRPGLAEGKTSPHNVYLIFFAELGLPGLIMIVSFNLTLLILALRRRNYYFIMAIVPIVLIGQNVELVYYEAPYIYLWAVLASLGMTLRNDELPGWRPPLPPGIIPLAPPGRRAGPPFMPPIPRPQVRHR